MTGRRRVPLAIAGIVLVAAGVALVWYLRGPRSDPEALRLMASAANALQEVSVRGIVDTSVRTHGGLLRMRAEVHRGAGRAHIKYLSDSMPVAEVFKQGHQVWAKEADGSVHTGGQVRAAMWHERLIERNYTARLGEKATLLGRPVTYVTGDSPAGQLTLAVDDETGFPLVMVRKGRDGETLMETSYSSVDFGVAPPPEVKPPAEALDKPRRGGRRVSREELLKEIGFTLLVPSYVPERFELQGYYLRQRGPRKMVEIRYADGLRVLLVLEHKQPERGQAGPSRREGHGRKHMDQMRALHGPGVRKVVGETVAIVVGPLPPKELARIADSLSPSP